MTNKTKNDITMAAFCVFMALACVAVGLHHGIPVMESLLYVLVGWAPFLVFFGGFWLVEVSKKVLKLRG